MLPNCGAMVMYGDHLMVPQAGRQAGNGAGKAFCAGGFMAPPSRARASLASLDSINTGLAPEVESTMPQGDKMNRD